MSCKPEITDEIPANLNAVDLGLSVKWSSCNLGANRPEESGSFYFWGETASRPESDLFDWKTYKWGNGNEYYVTKYCAQDGSAYWVGRGTPDGKTTLDPEDDAAHVKLGGKWRMPTYEEFIELLKCTWEWTEMNRVVGFTVTGPSGNSIFLPGKLIQSSNPLIGNYWYMGYWTSSLSEAPGKAHVFEFKNGHHAFGAGERASLYAIRPVTE